MLKLSKFYLIFVAILFLMLTNKTSAAKSAKIKLSGGNSMVSQELIAEKVKSLSREICGSEGCIEVVKEGES